MGNHSPLAVGLARPLFADRRRILDSKNIQQRAATALGVVVALFLLVACSGKPKVSHEPLNRAESPRLSADSVTTLISDSGITRYRITAKTWRVYDMTEEPHWDFPDGLHLESFDAQFNVAAEISCKRAIYYDKKRLWQLDDSVRAMNYEGNHFATQQLFWDQNTERIYSDSLITIDQIDKQIVGEGFESNQTMTRYTIRRVSGIFPVEN